jgi:hypothetical protein
MAMLMINGDRSLNCFFAAAQFFIALGNPSAPLLNITGHKVDAKRKKGPVSFPQTRSTSLLATLPVSHS